MKMGVGGKDCVCVQKVHLNWYMPCVYEKYPALILFFALVGMGGWEGSSNEDLELLILGIQDDSPLQICVSAGQRREEGDFL